MLLMSEKKDHVSAVVSSSTNFFEVYSIPNTNYNTN